MQVRSELQQILWSLRKGWWAVAVFSGVVNLLMLVPTLYMLQVYDRVLVSRSGMTLLVVSLVTVGLMLLMMLAEVWRSRLLVRLGVRLDAALSNRVFRAGFQATGVSPGQQGPARALASLLELRQFLTGHGVLAFLDGPWTPIYLAVLFLLHPLLGAVSCVFALAQAALVWLGHQRLRSPAQALQRAWQEDHQLLREQLRQAEVASSMGMWSSLSKRWQQKHQAYGQAHAASNGLAHRVSAWSKWLRYSQQSLSLAAGGWLVTQGEISVGAMIVTNVLMTKALAPIDQMVNLWRQWLEARAAYHSLNALLQEHPEPTGLRKLETPRFELTLRNVNATVQGRARPILDNINLQIQPGTVTVILGPSGSGKSTLARVMLGIWPEVTGEVLLDDVALTEWDRTALGPRLGYLPQEVELFDGTVAQNIARFGEVDAQAVVTAAQQASLHSLLLRMPQGYDTRVGEYGARLSGGQRQRIGLARAMYGGPAFVVLDEPNAHLDEVGEKALAEAVAGMKDRGQTVVLITHRPAIVGQADQLVLMCEGRIQWQGPLDQAQGLVAGSLGAEAAREVTKA